MAGKRASRDHPAAKAQKKPAARGFTPRVINGQKSTSPAPSKKKQKHKKKQKSSAPLPATSPAPLAPASFHQTSIDVELMIRAEAERQNRRELLLAHLEKLSGEDFEHFCLAFLKALGYGGPEGNGRVVGGLNDHGIDFEISDPLGLHTYIGQCKRLNNNRVRERNLRDFIGALVLAGKTHGIFMTNSSFSGNAQQAARQVAPGLIIHLIDGETICAVVETHKLWHLLPDALRRQAA